MDYSLTVEFIRQSLLRGLSHYIGEPVLYGPDGRRIPTREDSR